MKSQMRSYLLKGLLGLSLFFFCLLVIQFTLLQAKMTLTLEFLTRLNLLLVLIGCSGLSFFIYILIKFKSVLIRSGSGIIAIIAFVVLAFLQFFEIEEITTYQENEHVVYVMVESWGTTSYRLYQKRNLFTAEIIGYASEWHDETITFELIDDEFVVTIKRENEEESRSYLLD